MSFLSVEPQSRAVLESHSNSILSQFDTHLKIIQNRYLAFFEERQQIEVTYIDSLRKLHRNATTVDASFDARFEPTNIRSAWSSQPLRLVEASTHQTLVNTLDRDVIKPLKRLKETKDATRKRIRGDLKGSAETYADYAEKTIRWFQQAFLKKYHPQEYDHSPEVSQRPQVVRNKSFGGKVSALFRGRREDSREPQLQAQLAKANMSRFEEGIYGIIHEFQLDLQKMHSELVDDDDYRKPLPTQRVSMDRIEDLGDGYITTRVKYGDLEKRAATEVKTA
ncbi:hypothetical protein EI94DRAFT_1699303 [Lactarius quietus]|nr:hypothetical protein EI94DRAFT_1699303 [Lactarius quietus]